MTQMNQHLFTAVRKDMRIIDADGHDIGDVDTVYMGGASDDAIVMGGNAAVAPDVTAAPANDLVTAVGQAFADDNIPEVLQRRMLKDGYIKMDSSGLLSRDRYILPEQVDHIDQHVHLNVRKADLMHK